MEETPVTKADMFDVRNQLQRQISEGFAGVHERQDVTNGRILAAEKLTAEHGIQLKSLEREVFGRRRDDRDPPPAAPEPAGDKRGITERDVRMFVAGVGALAASATFVWKVLPFLLAVLRQHP